MENIDDDDFFTDEMLEDGVNMMQEGPLDFLGHEEEIRVEDINSRSDNSESTDDSSLSPQEVTVQSIGSIDSNTFNQAVAPLMSSLLGTDVESKTVYEILTKIVNSDLKLSELIDIAVVLIGTVDIDHPIVRSERRNKENLKLRLERSRPKIIPLLQHPVYQYQLYTQVWGQRMSPDSQKAKKTQTSKK